MSASSQEREKVWTELQSLRQDTQAFRTEAYRLRTAGSLDAATNERLRSQQLELERRGEALIKQLSPGLEWNVGLGSASDDAMNVVQLPPSAGQPQLAAGNSLQLQNA
ncbi:hypothetical protein H4582DRAFT_2106833 [Lactarius indigo]|nr:hypothetical protein H4582DRAFT_2106833 [Lactarius indigo]